MSLLFLNFVSKKSSAVFWKQACIPLLQPAEARHPFSTKQWEEFYALSSLLFVQHSHICSCYIKFSSELIKKTATTSSDQRRGTAASIFSSLSAKREISLHRILLKKSSHTVTNIAAFQWWQPASCKTHMDALMLSRCQGDDTFVAIQPMGIFRFWRDGELTFFPKMSIAPLLFSVLAPYPCEVSCFELASSYLMIPSAHSTIEQEYEKIEGCEQSAVVIT